ncbi:MAG: histidine ammonia-lyase [Anaerolineae bacterium]|nr:histidine ammonia-lyase [Anaerolineae bacterium]
MELDGNHLTISQIVAVARHGEKVGLSTEGRSSLLKSRQNLEKIISTGKAVYGINTGFGIFSDTRIPIQDAAQLSRNLILSHAVGTGIPFDQEVVRAGMLIRANTLTKGFSGVRVEIVETILEMLNKNVVPLIPSQGSLGSSGDLCPLSHMALVFTTDGDDKEEDSGFAWFDGELMSGKAAMQKAGIPRLILGAKEGLALNNGATFSAAVASLAVYDTAYLLDIADVALCLSLEALLGCSSAFDDRLHQARGHKGQIVVAENVRRLIKNSSLVDAAGRVQDAYSLRCAPQVQGAARETLRFVNEIISREINAATDNPLIFNDEEVLSGGNFHGEAIGMAMDFLSIAICEVGAISERRTFRLTDGKLNGGLPAMLVDDQYAAGLNSGLMMPQYTAVSLVLENQTLCGPDSVRSLPTSGEQEDHNANSMTAARHTKDVLNNTHQVLAIEMYTAARALDLRLRQIPSAQLGKGTSAAYKCIRQAVPYQTGDAWWGPEITRVKQLIEEKMFPKEIAKVIID